MDEKDLKDEVYTDDLGIDPAVGEVLKAADLSKLDKRSTHIIKEIRRFIIGNNIKPGKTGIFSEMVYDLYVQWSDAPVSPQWFTQHFRLFFRRSTWSDRFYYYKLDPKPFGVEEDFSVYTAYKQKAGLLKKKKTKLNKYYGVYRLPFGGFVARAKNQNGETVSLGFFKTPKEAAINYDKYVYLLWGRSAHLNFPGRIKEYEKEYREK
jgi:hypothetical protein